jgi:sec-independent protein translocase protein TatA
MGSLGVPETIFIFVLALLVFGPKKLPELGRTIGKAMTEFRRASSELKATFDREMHSIERENESLKEVTQKYVDDTTYSQDTYNHDNYYDSGAYGGESYDSPADDQSSVSASAPQGADTTVTTTEATESASNTASDTLEPGGDPVKAQESETVKS